MKKIVLAIISVAAFTVFASKVWLMVTPVAGFAPSPILDAASDNRTTIAFVGDHGTRPASLEVFELIKREGADLLVSQGDFGYDSTATEFEAVLDATLGPDFPIVAVLGNHDWSENRQYRTFFAERLARTPEVTCQGDIAVRSTCSYRGIDIISTTPDITSSKRIDSGANFLDRYLRASESRWKICNWHKNQSAFQLGKKKDDVGWGSYEACRKHGALIVTAHEHSYSRTFPITRMTDPPVYLTTDPSLVKLRPGQTTVIVSGLGGQSVREERRTGSWWATKYTKDQGTKDGGALFCTFEEAGLSDEAQCRFVNVDGDVIDEFRIDVGQSPYSS